MTFTNLCRFNAASGGISAFVVASAVAGCFTPAQANAIDGNTYFYFARSSDSFGFWEYGSGIYSVGSTSLTRVKITSTSSGILTPVNFGSFPPIVDVFPNPPASIEPVNSYASGVRRSNNLVTVDPSFFRGSIGGLIHSVAGGVPSFGVTAGAAVSDDDTAFMSMASTITKTIGAFLPGNSGGCLDSGSTVSNNTWYHNFLIQRPDTLQTDILTSLSTTPALPTNYTTFRRIGSLKTDSSGNWLKVNQLGDEFLWGTPSQDIVGYTATLTPASIVLAGVPTGVNTRAVMNVMAGQSASASSGLLLYELGAPSGSSVANNNMQIFVPTAGQLAASYVEVRTNGSAQIGIVAATANMVVFGNTTAYFDIRGKQ